MKFKLRIFFKTIVITFFILIFFSLILFIANEGANKLNGEGVSVCFNNSNLCLRKGDKEYCLKPDKKRAVKIYNAIYSNPSLLPAPFNFAFIANCLLNSLIQI